ncbi:hypothetical protein AMAG_19217 [Allomyces macrogynus ATCC 38327]|uniref:ABC transmembrane type-1 domain-containing protein n=1 Tax=Allomyces macrogynus (strain ATCC 38327) TaxID=578462 RepID=A0A0L0STU0_ALLM3|nr:hypothetical protein AMAG_19217 [Allomyces macrogynus ATCC 38327]|eukprot:KNE65815.1 hypothetical protein AMAG_19217 [Allomyces macrogynus ATCC 38327]
MTMTWQIVHALFSKALALTMAHVLLSRSFQFVVVAAVDALCFLIYLRYSLVGVMGISMGHALPIVYSSLAMVLFISSALVYHRAITLAQDAILAASSDDMLTPSLEPFVSLWQRATFSWLTLLMHRGSQHALQLGDLGDLVTEDTSAVALEAWLAIRLDFLSNVTVMACGILILLCGVSSAGFAGLAMAWSMTNIDPCSHFVNWLALMEMNMISIERILEYSDLEGETSGGTTPTTDEWPTDGAIKSSTSLSSTRRRRRLSCRTCRLRCGRAKSVASLAEPERASRVWRSRSCA